jgi:hypothetical protein
MPDNSLIEGRPKVQLMLGFRIDATERVRLASVLSNQVCHSTLGETWGTRGTKQGYLGVIWRTRVMGVSLSLSAVYSCFQ